MCVFVGAVLQKVGLLCSSFSRLIWDQSSGDLSHQEAFPPYVSFYIWKVYCGQHFLLHTVSQFHTVCLFPRPLALTVKVVGRNGKARFQGAKICVGMRDGGVGHWDGWDAVKVEDRERGMAESTAGQGGNGGGGKSPAGTLGCQGFCHVSCWDWLLWASGCFGVHIKRTGCEHENTTHFTPHSI